MYKQYFRHDVKRVFRRSVRRVVAKLSRVCVPSLLVWLGCTVGADGRRLRRPEPLGGQSGAGRRAGRSAIRAVRPAVQAVRPAVRAGRPGGRTLEPCATTVVVKSCLTANICTRYIVFSSQYITNISVTSTDILPIYRLNIISETLVP